jgi:glycine cleavage system H protein
MSEIPSELRYTQSHEWVRQEDDGTVTVGITDHAQGLLGDLVFVELPEVGSEMAAGEACCVVESVKAASDAYMPISGEVLEVNEALVDAPEMINDSAFDDGWLFKVQPTAEQEINSLMDADAYQEEIDE